MVARKKFPPSLPFSPPHAPPPPPPPVLRARFFPSHYTPLGSLFTRLKSHTLWGHRGVLSGRGTYRFSENVVTRNALRISLLQGIPCNLGLSERSRCSAPCSADADSKYQGIKGLDFLHVIYVATDLAIQFKLYKNKNHYLHPFLWRCLE